MADSSQYSSSQGGPDQPEYSDEDKDEGDGEAEDEMEEEEEPNADGSQDADDEFSGSESDACQIAVEREVCA